jgi:hypothetical protein
MSITRVTHRGIRWQRDSQGRIRWWNEDRDGWVRWRPGDDAPPRPPGWEQREAPAGPPPLTRPAWRSPYRLVPLALAVLILVAGLVQALRSGGSGGSSSSEAAKAQAYEGRCLPKTGSGPSAGYSPTTVACSAANAAGKVVAVVTWAQGHTACPARTTAAILTSGPSHPHFECIRALGSP